MPLTENEHVATVFVMAVRAAWKTKGLHEQEPEPEQGPMVTTEGTIEMPAGQLAEMET
jgi:hypothetical protein